MAIDYFEKELKTTQQRFNQTFGMLDVYDLKSRRSTILAIVSLGLIACRIKRTKDKDDVRGEIKRFMRTKTVLDGVFKQIEKHQKERRGYAKSAIDGKRKADRKRNIAG